MGHFEKMSQRNPVSTKSAVQKAVNLLSRRAPSKSPIDRPAKTPVDGVNAAHVDMLSYLYASHGELYDTYVAKVEQATGLKREQLSYVAYGLMVVYLIFGSSAKLMCNLIGFGYPAYASVKAIRTKETEDDTRWLIYWTVFATFSLFDFFSESLFRIFPFYFVAKALLLVYLYLPQTEGAVYFYQKVVNPLVSLIDNFLADKQKSQ